MDKKKVLHAITQLRAGYIHILNDLLEDGETVATIKIQGILAQLAVEEENILNS